MKKIKKIEYIPPNFRFALHYEALIKFNINPFCDRGLIPSRIHGKIGSYIRTEAKKRGLVEIWEFEIDE